MPDRKGEACLGAVDQAQQHGLTARTRCWAMLLLYLSSRGTPGLQVRKMARQHIERGETYKITK